MDNLMKIVNLVVEKYIDDITLIIDKDLLIIQYMYIRDEERDVYKLMQVREIGDKFYIHFVEDKIEKAITINELEDIFKIYKKQSSRHHLSSVEINYIKEKYIKGTKIELIKMYDINAVPPKTKGVVEFVDDIGQIHIKWDNGSTLALNVEIDKFKIIK